MLWKLQWKKSHWLNFSLFILSKENSLTKTEHSLNSNQVRFTLCISSCDSFDKAWKPSQNLFWHTETEHNKCTIKSVIYGQYFERSTLRTHSHRVKEEAGKIKEKPTSMKDYSIFRKILQSDWLIPRWANTRTHLIGRWVWDLFTSLGGEFKIRRWARN